MNRDSLRLKASAAATECLAAKGYIAPVDVLVAMGMLTREDSERWRRREVPCLEGVMRGSLGSISFVMRTLIANSQRGNLKPSWTAYVSWGKGRRGPLRFSRSGDPNIERAYATHWLRANGAATAPNDAGPSQARPVRESR